MNSVLMLATFLVIVFVVAGIGGLLTSSGMKGWYQMLRKPAWSPPNWVFAPVWGALYVMMAFAAWAVWASESPLEIAALTLWVAQLALNIAWSMQFFYLRKPGWAFAVIILLLAMVVSACVMFFFINVWAGVLFIPYIAWVAFASALNYSVWQLNRQR